MSEIPTWAEIREYYADPESSVEKSAANYWSKRHFRENQKPGKRPIIRANLKNSAMRELDPTEEAARHERAYLLWAGDDKGREEFRKLYDLLRNANYSHEKALASTDEMLDSTPVEGIPEEHPVEITPDMDPIEAQTRQVVRLIEGNHGGKRDMKLNSSRADGRRNSKIGLEFSPPGHSAENDQIFRETKHNNENDPLDPWDCGEPSY